jgi:hypothetical protein
MHKQGHSLGHALKSKWERKADEKPNSIIQARAKSIIEPTEISVHRGTAMSLYTSQILAWGE